MSTPDFFAPAWRPWVNMRHPLLMLTAQLPWARIEAALARKFSHQERAVLHELADDLLGEYAVEFCGGVSNAGRPRLSIRPMASLLYLKNSFNLSDEELVERWSENVVWQFLSDMAYYEPRLPCDASQIGRFRRAIGEEALEQPLKCTIETAVEVRAIKPTELERAIARLGLKLIFLRLLMLAVIAPLRHCASNRHMPRAWLCSLALSSTNWPGRCRHRPSHRSDFNFAGPTK
jgi:IS5 family transposase